MNPGWSQTGVPAGTEEGERTVQSLFSEMPPSSGGSRWQRTPLLVSRGRPGVPWSLGREAHWLLPSWDNDKKPPELPRSCRRHRFVSDT